jgi:hypothetical protein
MKKPWLLIAGIAMLGLAAILMVNSKPAPKAPAPVSDDRTSPAPVDAPAGRTGAA